MKLFISISILLHALLLLIAVDEEDLPKQRSTPVEIVRKEAEVVSPEPPAATPIEKPTPPAENKPTSSPVAPSPIEKPSEMAIIPREYNPDQPPAPISLEELIREQRERDRLGPDRPPEEIVRDYLDNQTLPAGEDRVSFNGLNLKYESYFYRFAKNVYGIWKYPIEAAMRGQAGIVRVSFSIMKDGRITNITMVESSGYPSLDREVMRTLRTLPPAPLPDSFGLNIMHINGYFIYSLTGEYRLY